MQTPISDLDPKEALAAAINAVFNAQSANDQVLIELAGRHFQGVVNMLDISWKPDCLAALDAPAPPDPAA